jgi:hypothetical protein
VFCDLLQRFGVGRDSVFVEAVAEDLCATNHVHVRNIGRGWDPLMRLPASLSTTAANHVEPALKG